MQMSTPPRNSAASASSSNAYPTTPDASYLGHHTAPNTHPKFPRARCYRLNLEKPFDITKCVSPLGKNAGFSSRDYSGPIHEADLPPVQGPVEYHPPPHLATPSVGDLMANLQVSKSEDSVSETTIAITTAEIFRGITVDRKTGLITGMNSRATRSRKDKGKNMQGEKSRQAAKIDKAKDLIDDVVENGGGDTMGNEENDPSKILSLFIMGEYEELNDLVLDGSKKLRDYKSQPDEVLARMNRPQPLGYNQSSDNHHINFPSSPANASLGSSLTSFSSRKRGFSKDRVRQKFNIMPKSAPPKIKPHSRDGPSKRLVGGGGGGASVNTSPVHSPNSRYASAPLQDSYRAQPSSNNWGMEVDDNTSSNFAQCNLKSDWHDIFFHNSLWNCGNVNAAATSSTPNQSPRNQGYNNGNDQSYNGGQYSAYGAGAGGYYSRNGYDEGRNPSGGYGYTRGNSNGVRDSTVVM